MAELTLKVDPAADEVDQVLRGLFNYNDCAHPAPSGYRPLGLFVRERAGAPIVGGLTGWAAYDWLFIQCLHIPVGLRGQGLGTEMMRRAEVWSREQGLAGIHLDTFEFQARGFYEALGFSVFGTLEDHPLGSRRYFMSKRFSDTAP